jgi:hypothetical protein
MNIEPYVVSLKIAKQLKSAGYPQNNCLFYRDKKKGRIYFYDESEVQGAPSLFYAAPISDEILDKLPEKYDMSFGVEGFIYLCGKRKKYIFDKETSRPDALAELWLRAKKEGYFEDKKS